MNPNQRFAELTGICWHKRNDSLSTDSGYCWHCHEWLGPQWIGNPDFTDSREVLKVMMDREDWINFADIHFLIATINIDGTTTYAIQIDLILNRTGELRDAAIEWMERRKG